MNDFYKEKISYYKLLLTFSITAIYGMIGWYFGRNIELNEILKTAAILAAFAVIVSIGAIVYKIRYYTEKLKGE